MPKTSAVETTGFEVKPPPRSCQPDQWLLGPVLRPHREVLSDDEHVDTAVVMGDRGRSRLDEAAEPVPATPRAAGDSLVPHRPVTADDEQVAGAGGKRRRRIIDDLATEALPRMPRRGRQTACPHRLIDADARHVQAGAVGRHGRDRRRRAHRGWPSRCAASGTTRRRRGRHRTRRSGRRRSPPSGRSSNAPPSDSPAGLDGCGTTPHRRPPFPKTSKSGSCSPTNCSAGATTEIELARRAGSPRSTGRRCVGGRRGLPRRRRRTRRCTS